jgi:hypothetical protein
MHAEITMPMKKSCLGLVLRVRISTPKMRPYRYQFIQENQADRVRGTGVQCEDTSGPKVREVHSLVLARSDEHRLGILWKLN